MALRAAKYIGDLLAQLNDGYNALTDMQGDAVVGTSSPQILKHLASHQPALVKSVSYTWVHFSSLTLQGWMRKK